MFHQVISDFIPLKHTSVIHPMLRFPKKAKLLLPINQANQLVLMFLDNHQGPQSWLSCQRLQVAQQ
jgi:hypothetical protein